MGRLRLTILQARLELPLGYSDGSRRPELAGIPYRYLQDIEAQRRPGKRLAPIERVAKALGVEPWELLKPAQFPLILNKRGKSAAA